jgi:hypothetical protein
MKTGIRGPRGIRGRSETVKIPKALSPGEEAFAMHCRVEHLTPEREYQFHLLRLWRFDFAWPEKKIAVEVEGRGRHQSVSGFEADAVKYNAGECFVTRRIWFIPGKQSTKFWRCCNDPHTL